ncbi:MAG: hypothetical protein HPY90_15975 [Syntrophothermus sp.]|uniref:hypothetical protein n=1 Tax=Syntrophothermus sp. TaxID=2736299 RepID=UPI00257F7F9D|nr:hypothetical protein [Syntrophothermus sp.]NSW84684.1 hypothetical protein [Syntrophothermus sp.]
MSAMGDLKIMLEERGITNPADQKLYLNLRQFGKGVKLIKYKGRVKTLRKVLGALRDDLQTA